jgi:uncharacterized protein YdhG (YjbR/CyaY superfamily)
VLDQLLLDRIRGLLRTRTADRRELFLREIARIANELNAKGLLGSGVMVQRISDLAATELRISVREIRGTIQRVIGELAVPHTVTLPADMKHELSIHASEAKQRVIDALIANSHLIPSAVDVELPYKRAIEESNAELDLFLDRLVLLQRKALDAAPRSNVIHVHAPSIVQTGDYTTASLTLNVNQESRAAVLAAIHAVSTFLSSNPDVPRLGELRQIAEEVRTEVGKEHPNASKLYALLQVLAAAASGIASGGQVYEVVRNAITLLGG